MRTWYGLATAVVLLSLSPNSATVKTREIEYRQGETALQGFVAWDDAARGRRPGVLVVHEWWGLNEHARNQARRLAEVGYVGFAGGADPFVPPEQLEAFKREMQAAGARFEVTTYPGAKHGFTNPDAAQYGMPQLAYDAAADRESWAAMLKLFKEIWPS